MFSKLRQGNPSLSECPASELLWPITSHSSQSLTLAFAFCNITVLYVYWASPTPQTFLPTTAVSPAQIFIVRAGLSTYISSNYPLSLCILLIRRTFSRHILPPNCGTDSQEDSSMSTTILNTSSLSLTVIYPKYTQIPLYSLQQTHSANTLRDV